MIGVSSVIGRSSATHPLEVFTHPPGHPEPVTARHIRRSEIDELRELHANAWLDEAEAERYAILRARLLDAAAAAQSEAAAGPRRTPRASVRARRALAVDIGWGEQRQRGLTLDLGGGGFAALLAAAPPEGERVVARLQLSRREEVVLAARVVARRERRGTCRVSFAFEDAGPGERAAVERHLVDGALLEVTLAAARSAR